MGTTRRWHRASKSRPPLVRMAFQAEPANVCCAEVYDRLIQAARQLHPIKLPLSETDPLGESSLLTPHDPRPGANWVAASAVSIDVKLELADEHAQRRLEFWSRLILPAR